MKSLFALLNAVLAVGQNQGHQVSLQLVTNDVQVGQIRGTHFVAERGEIQGKYGKLALLWAGIIAIIIIIIIIIVLKFYFYDTGTNVENLLHILCKRMRKDFTHFRWARLLTP